MSKPIRIKDDGEIEDIQKDNVKIDRSEILKDVSIQTDKFEAILRKQAVVLEIKKRKLKKREEELVSREEELVSREEELDYRKEEFDYREQELNLREQELNIREEELVSREEELNLRKDALDEEEILSDLLVKILFKIDDSFNETKSWLDELSEKYYGETGKMALNEMKEKIESFHKANQYNHKDLEDLEDSEDTNWRIID